MQARIASSVVERVKIIQARTHAQNAILVEIFNIVGAKLHTKFAYTNSIVAVDRSRRVFPSNFLDYTLFAMLKFPESLVS